MSVTLKPCPFCGGEAYFLTTQKVKNSAFVAVGVECRKCGAYPYSTMVYEGATDEDMKKAAAKAWNRRIEEEPRFYICTENFLLPDIGEEGEMLDTQTEIVKGSIWERSEDKYRICGAPDTILLENAEGKWMEISPERFSSHFEGIRRVKE